MPSTLEDVLRDEWEVVTDSYYHRMYRSQKQWTLEGHAGHWMLIASLSKCGLLVVSSNPLIEKNHIANQAILLEGGLKTALVKYQTYLFLITINDIKPRVLGLTEEQLNAFDQAMDIYARKMNCLSRIMMSEINLVAPLLPVNTSLFDTEQLSACAYNVQKWNIMNPHFPAFEFDDLFWIAPDVGNVTANDENTAEMLIKDFLRTGMIPVNACKTNHVLTYKNKLVYVNPELAIEHEAILKNIPPDKKIAYWNHYFKTTIQDGKKITITRLQTLLYLSINIPADAITQQYLSPTMLSILHFFYYNNYPLTLNKMDVLLTITQCEPINMKNIQTKFELSKIGKGLCPTIITYCISNYKLDILCDLMARRKDLWRPDIINAVDPKGQTALMMAIDRQLLDCVEFLLRFEVNLTHQDNNGHNAIDKAWLVRQWAAGFRICKLLLLTLASYPKQDQSAALANIDNGIYKDVFRLTALNCPDIFHEASKLALRHPDWKEDVSILIQLKEQLHALNFDENLDYFKSKIQTGSPSQHSFSDFIKDLHNELKQARNNLFLSELPLRQRWNEFKLVYEHAFKQTDYYFAYASFPKPIYSSLFFLSAPDDFKARYMDFKLSLEQFLKADDEYVLVDEPFPDSL